jgi:hypothetical protein
MEKNTIDLLNEVSSFSDIAEFMDDKELTHALVMVAKLIAKPDITPAAAAQLIVLLQAYSTKFAMQATWYANVKKDERAKKNLYYSAREAIDKLVDALKYTARSYNG